MATAKRKLQWKLAKLNYKRRHPERLRESKRRYVKKHADRVRHQRNEDSRRKRARFRALLERVKSVPCADCGGTFPPHVMDLDHVRGNKVFNLSLGTRFRRAQVHAEIAKCEVVCANCHRQRTHARGDHFAAPRRARARQLAFEFAMAMARTA